MRRHCNHDGCLNRIQPSNITGLCLKHLNERRGAHVQRCRICNDRLREGHKTGQCEWHTKKAVRHRNCAHCDEPIEVRNKTGFCAKHMHPHGRVPAGRRPEFDYLVRGKGMAPLEALAALANGPVLIPVDPPVRNVVLPSEIIAMVAAELRTSPELIKSTSRHSPDVAARACLVQIFRARGMSFPQIGHRLGGRDHSTVIHSYRNFDGYADRFPMMRRVVARVMERMAA